VAGYSMADELAIAIRRRTVDVARKAESVLLTRDPEFS